MLAITSQKLFMLSFVLLYGNTVYHVKNGHESTNIRHEEVDPDLAQKPIQPFIENIDPHWFPPCYLQPISCQFVATCH